MYDTYTEPIHTYVNDGFGGSIGCSVTGGHVYRGSMYPNLNGHYVFGDYCSGRIYTIYDDGGAMGWETTTQENTDYNFSSFGEDMNGELYLADQISGIIYSIVDDSEVSDIKEIKASNVSIYPNPITNNGTITFDISKSTYKVVISDVTAKTVMKKTITNNKLKLDANLKNGVYFIEIGNTYKSKLIIK